jgi:hypothetical protein
MTNETGVREWWSDSHGYIELQLDLEDAATGYHSGQCDDDIAALRAVPYIAEQLERLDPETVALSLRGWGAWDNAELAKHDDNLSRLLWLACADIAEQCERQK